MTSIARSISSLRPNSEWTLTGDTLDGLVWLDKSNPRPSNSEIYAEVARLQAEYERTEYQRQRASEYPPITDYLDGIVKNDRAQIEAYVAACVAVKAKYPKGGE